MPQARRRATRPVSAADLERLIGAANSLASLRSLADLRRQAVEIVQRLVPGTMVAWNEVDLRGRQIEAVISPPLERVTSVSRDTLNTAFIEHIAEHPVISHFRRTGDGRPYAISDFLSAPAFHATGLYRDFYRHLRAEDQLSFVLPDPLLVIGIALNRERRGFPPRDRQVCNLLRPHLLQAYRTVEATARMSRISSTLEHLAGDAGLGIIRLSGAGPRYESNAVAQGILNRCFAMQSPAELPAEIARWLAGRSPAAPPALVLERPGGRRLTVYRASTGTGELLVLAEGEQTPLPPDVRGLGLTAREAEILVLVRAGLSTKRIASRLGISGRTVDKHVQHTLDKLGVRTRLQAIALIEPPRF